MADKNVASIIIELHEQSMCIDRLCYYILVQLLQPKAKTMISETYIPSLSNTGHLQILFELLVYLLMMYWDSWREPKGIVIQLLRSSLEDGICLTGVRSL